MTGAEDLGANLAGLLTGPLGGPVAVEDLQRLPGGASRQTWSFAARAPGGERRLVLRRDPPGTPPSGLALEVDLLREAARVGVPVPGVVAAGTDPAALGSAYLIMDFVEGETIPRRILRRDDLADARRVLAAQCGQVLARIHAMSPTAVAGLPGGDALEQLRGILDRLGEPHPAFELALRWLSERRPPRSGEAVVHGDFRNGNLVVGPDGIRAVLDWELAHRGDPLEDLGWLCVKAWRFGEAPAVGGFGDRAELVAAYEEASATTVDPDALAWWEVLGTLRWGVICIVQASTHLLGLVRSVELAAIGRRVCETERDLLELTGVAPSGAGAPDPAGGDPAGDGPAGDGPAGDGGPGPERAWPDEPHDVPGASELLEAVREYLLGPVTEHSDGQVRFHARVAANVLSMVQRQLMLGPGQARRHRRRLAALGVASEAELAAAIREHRLDDRRGEVEAAVAATVADKLAVANPDG